MEAAADTHFSSTSSESRRTQRLNWIACAQKQKHTKGSGDITPVYVEENHAWTLPQNPQSTAAIH
jgi:hypothetical protein